jgi:hypothetical protein
MACRQDERQQTDDGHEWDITVRKMETSGKATSSIDVLVMGDRYGIGALRYVPKNQLDLSRLLFHCDVPYANKMIYII